MDPRLDLLDLRRASLISMGFTLDQLSQRLRCAKCGCPLSGQAVATNRRAWEAARTAWMTMKLLPLASVLTITNSVTLAADDNPSIEELLKTGWQIAGNSRAFDNRSTFILFRNPVNLISYSA